MTCPTCNGKGDSWALVSGIREDGRRFCEQRTLPCYTCNGTGAITPEHAARIAEGERMRKDRIARCMSLREEAARLGISPVTLSHREQGREN